jgi:single-strand DNA-binding protein
MNSINITGRLTSDPELRAIPRGETVCKLRLAVDGLAPRGETGYVNVTCFGKPGEAAARVLSKGWLVAVQGRLAYREWEGDDGSKRHDYELVGNVEFLAAPRSNGARDSAERKEVAA